MTDPEEVLKLIADRQPAAAEARPAAEPTVRETGRSLDTSVAAPPRTVTLRDENDLFLHGRATDHIWTMAHAGNTIGIRMDSGHSGVVFVTIDQARDLAEQLTEMVDAMAAPPPVETPRLSCGCVGKCVGHQLWAQAETPRPAEPPSQEWCQRKAERVVTVQPSSGSLWGVQFAGREVQVFLTKADAETWATSERERVSRILAERE